MVWNRDDQADLELHSRGLRALDIDSVGSSARQGPRGQGALRALRIRVLVDRSRLRAVEAHESRARTTQAWQLDLEEIVFGLVAGGNGRPLVVSGGARAIL